MGACQGTRKRGCSARGGYLRPRTCLRKGCGRQYLPRAGTNATAGNRNACGKSASGGHQTLDSLSEGQRHFRGGQSVSDHFLSENWTVTS